MNQALDAQKLGISLIEKIESAGFAARFAGGSVRDRLLGKTPHDYDIATDALPEQICSIFTQKTHKVIPTGLDHGTVTVVYRTIPFEITTLRKDVRTDGRHAEVAFGGTFAEDAERRDFTVNAMFEDAQGKIYDYFSGQEDLKAKQLRFVGEPRQRIREDYLRILRFFRFWAKLDFTPDPAALSAIAAEKAGLAHISVERITSELRRMLKAGPSAMAPLEAMVDIGVLEVIFTISASDSASSLATLKTLWDGKQNDTEAKQKLVADDQLPLIQLAIIINSAHKRAEEILTSKLRLSNGENRLIVHFLSILTGETMVDVSSQATMMEFLDDCDKACGKAEAFLTLYEPVLTAIELPSCSLTQEDLKALASLEKAKAPLRQAKLPLSGKDLAKLGIPMDRTCGEILARLKTSYRNEEWETAQEGLELAQTLHDAMH